MKVPLSWLRDYVDIDISVDELKDKLFSCGFEVEEIICTGKEIEKIVVAKILEITKHPNADKLFVCRIDAGKYGNDIQIVTGANNINVGDKIAVALDGATVFGGKKIVAGELRGVKSYGMMCSGEELGINDDYYHGASVNGILIIRDEVPLGIDVKGIVGLNDIIFDISVTANRPDCQCIFGIAREVAAVTKKQLKTPFISIVKNNTLNTNDKLSVTVDAKDLCPRYIASYVENVKIKKSPLWLTRRLASVGIRSINNIVDITNFVLIEMGQPMHAFDYDNIADKSIVVRRAKSNEKIVTLDEKEFTLNESNLVICDGQKPVAIAGIMGGLNSGINENTKNIVFESAKFARDNIRRTSKALGQKSDSSARFEKGIDAFTNEFALKRALYLVQDLADATVSCNYCDILNETLEHKVIKTSISKINSVLGIDVSKYEILNILERLNFEVTLDDNDDDIICEAPLYRDDIDGYPDLAEEIIRMYGYEHINATFLNTAQITNGGLNCEQKNIEKLKDILVSQNLNEIISYSFVSPKDIEKFGYNKNSKENNYIKLLNPLGEDLSVMRTTLAPSMLNVLFKNMNKKNENCRFFEFAKVYFPNLQEELPIEEKMLSIGIYGDAENFFTLKGILESIADRFLLNFKYERANLNFLHPGRSAYILCNGINIGYLGEINPELSEKMNLTKKVYISEINYEKLNLMLTKNIVYKNISKYPCVDRDLAIVVDENVSWDNLYDAVLKAEIDSLQSVTLFDIYKGDNIPDNKKSMAFSMKFSSLDKTITLEESDSIINKILESIKLEVDGVLRS